MLKGMSDLMVKSRNNLDSGNLPELLVTNKTLPRSGMGLGPGKERANKTDLM